MKYKKPEIVRLGDALVAILQTEKASPVKDSAIPSRTTVNAYEADE